MNQTIKKKRFDELEQDVPSSIMGAGAANSVTNKTTAGFKPIVPTPNQNTVPEQSGGNGTSAGTAPGTANDYLEQALQMLSKQPEVSYTPGTYQSRYSDQIDAIINDILNSKYGGYNAETDPNYQQYKKTYLREADRTAEDVLGQYAAMNGGMPSTAAISAASQAGNYYKGQLAEKIPELEAAAYERYRSGLSGKRQNLSDLLAMEDLAYRRFADEENRKLAEYQQKQSEYDTALDRLLQSAEIAQGKEDNEATKALSQLNYGVMPSEAGLKALGIDAATARGLIGLSTTSDKTAEAVPEGLSEETMLKLLEFSAENGISPTDALLQFNEIASSSKESGGGLSAIQQKAATFENEEDLDNYLTRLAKNGLITKEEAFSIFEELLGSENQKKQTAADVPLQNRNWTLEDSGGNNWGGGIDNNAKVKDQFGNVFRLDDLVDELVKSGMSKKEAKAYVQLMQVQVGAVKS